MNRSIALLLVATLVLGPALAENAQTSAQQPTKPPAPAPQKKTGQEPKPGEGVIRAYADLVLIDVQVTGRDGKPVKDLKQEQFTITENGKAQKIFSFEYYDVETIETAAADDARPVVIPLGPVEAPETVREQVRDHRLSVLFYDMTSMQPDELLRATDAGLKFVREQVTPADLVAVLAFANRLNIIIPFTNDKAALERAVNSLRPGKDAQLADRSDTGGAAGEAAVQQETGAAFTADDTEFNIFNTDRKLAAIESVSEMLRALPGRKAMLHFGGGITQTGEENRSSLRSATDAANRANVSIYPVDTRGLLASVPGGSASEASPAGTAMFSGAAVMRQAGARQESRHTLETLAGDTGGQAFFDSGDFKEAFDKVQKDGTGYYLVGYYSEDMKRDGRWRDVRVKVNASGARVRHREGYYAPKDYGVYTAEDRERQLDEAMRADTPRVELPLALETAYFRIGKDEIFVPIAAKLASSALEWAQKRGRHEAVFDFLLEVRDEGFGGRPAAALRDTIKVKLDQSTFAQVQQRAIVYQGGVILGPGAYRLKFLARDNESGRVGTFEQPLILPATQEDKLQLSSMLLSSQLEPVRKTGEVEKKGMVQDAKLKTTPLEMGGERIIPSVTRVFTTQQKLYIFFQAYVPAKADPARLRAGLVFFRSGERVSETPLVEPSEVDAAGAGNKPRLASFRIALPLEKMAPGRYTVQALTLEPGGALAAFARAHFALRLPPATAAKTTSD